MNDPRADRSANRVEALTGIRIVAAGFVFLSHVGVPAFMPERVRIFANAGYNGVTLFFILSGFVLAWNYADRLTPLKPRALWSYAIARVARVYPMYLVALLWAAAPTLLSTGVKSDLGLHVLALQTWSPDVTFAFGYNGPSWSIGVELFLYACFPLMIFLLCRVVRTPRVLIWVGVGAVVVAVGLAWWFSATGRAALPSTDPGSAHRWLYRMPITRLSDFVVGAVASLLIRSHGKVSERVARFAQLLGGGVFIGLMLVPTLFLSVWSFDAVYLAPVALLLWGLAVGPRTVLARLLGTRTMVLAGEASYAFYLLHVPLLHRLGFTSVDGWRGWLFATGLQFGLILLAAVGAHVVIERPARRWLRRALDGRTPVL